MKILLISSNSSGAGGGEQYLVYLAKGLKKLGKDVVVLLLDKSYMDVWDNKFKAIGVEVKRADLVGLRDRPFRIFQSMRDKKQIDNIAELCKEIHPDIIHVNQQYDADGLDYLMGALRYGKAPIVSTIHMPMSITKHPRKNISLRTCFIKILLIDKIKTLTLKKWYEKYNFVKIFVSKAMRDEFSFIYGEDNSLNIIIYGIDNERIPYNADKIKTNVIGFCGRLDPQKNLHLLINSWFNSREKGLDSKLLIIGDGILRKEIERRLSEKAPRDSWEITGWVDNPQAFLKELDLLVFTSRFEGFPLAIIEACCMGKRCLSVNFPGASEFLKLITFLEIISSFDPNTLGDSIIECMKKSNPVNEEVKRVRSYFSCERMAQDTLCIYERLIKR